MSSPIARSDGSPVERLVVQVDQAINCRALYAAGHPNVTRSMERLVAALETACEARGEEAITFLAVGDDVVVGREPLGRGSLYLEQFVHLLTRRGVERLTLARGLTADECRLFVEPFAVGGVPAGSAHVQVGRVQARVQEGVDETALHEPLSGQSLDAAREAFTAFRTDGAGGLRRLEDVVWGLIEGLTEATRAVIPLAPLKNHDEYTFVHSINVSLLTIAQARAFGIQGDKLHELGLAALLHDVGKLKIPLEVLNKPGKLEGEQWQIMQGHAEQGARHLCSIEGTRPLAILVAYEHHMRFDGQAAYPTPRRSRRPNLVSQLTSISDVFDALCTTRPYSKARPRDVALGVLAERAGTFHDPFLVESFARIVTESGLMSGEEPPGS